MKKILSVLLALLLLLSSCSRRYGAEEILLAFCSRFGIDATVYSSLCEEGEEGYIYPETLELLYGAGRISAREFAIAVYGNLFAARELGVFVLGGGADTELYELATRRIDLLSDLSSGEGFIKKYHGVFIYGFVDNAREAELVLDGIL